MSKHILFLYSDAKYKNEILQHTDVLKALFHKFRKSVIFSLRYVDISPCRCKEESEALLNELTGCDAAIWHSSKESLCDENLFASNFLGVFAKEVFTGGRHICFPVANTSFSTSEDCATTESVLPLQNISKAISLAKERAEMSKHSLLVCQDSYTKQDTLLLTEFENSLGFSKWIDVTHKDFDEIIFECTHRIPSFDVLLTTEEKARVIKLHLSALQKVPCGACIWHTENAPIFRREILPYEEMTNSACASFLLSCACAIFWGMNEEVAGNWLRRSVALALDVCAAEDKESFLREVIRHINTPMRNRKGNPDDSKN